MNFNTVTVIAFAFLLSSCAPKSYFTTDIRRKVEAQSISIDRLQFYIDQDVELRRELASGNAEVTSGKIKFENGKYVHIILLKANTPGVCVEAGEQRLKVSFEDENGKNLTFGLPVNAPASSPYQIVAEEWIQHTQSWSVSTGKILYDGEVYYIQPEGADAKLLIKKSVVNKLEVKKRVMKGRKL